MACAICAKRKGKRSCPAKAAKICPACCGAEREVTISCPLDCRYLVESRDREPRHFDDPAELPYPELRVRDEYMDEHGEFIDFVGTVISVATMSVDGATDTDVRQGLDALVQTYKTRESGIYYDHKPESSYARGVVSGIETQLADFRKQEQSELGLSKTRDGDVLRALAFWLQLASIWDNKRPKGRAFISKLAGMFGSEGLPRPAEPSLIVPGV